LAVAPVPKRKGDRAPKAPASFYVVGLHVARFIHACPFAELLARGFETGRGRAGACHAGKERGRAASRDGQGRGSGCCHGTGRRRGKARARVEKGVGNVGQLEVRRVELSKGFLAFISKQNFARRIYLHLHPRVFFLEVLGNRLGVVTEVFCGKTTRHVRHGLVHDGGRKAHRFGVE
jgi:hypothetical protein